MAPGIRRASLVFPMAAALLTLFSVPLQAGMDPSGAGGSSSPLEAKWRQVIELRLDGRYDEAVGLLEAIVEEHIDSAEIVRRAYTERVFVSFAAADSIGMEDAAREAVVHFPDIQAPLDAYPPRIGGLYDRMRAELFGSLDFIRPQGARVYLDDKFRGEIPLRLRFVPVGSYRLRITQPGFREHTDKVEVAPGRLETLIITMSERPSFTRRLRRYGPLAAAAIVAGVLLWPDSDDSPPPRTGLPDPPPPPGSVGR